MAEFSCSFRTEDTAASQSRLSSPSSFLNNNYYSLQYYTMYDTHVRYTLQMVTVLNTPFGRLN